ncbi:D-alanyl-D-alanine carboxypeptidase [Candidatus Uhrbacteria bacterium]|nr:D-alanyl-D-alanine carboxypeptidase [Candidatus Uhrbacteria bacterium]
MRNRAVLFGIGMSVFVVGWAMPSMGYAAAPAVVPTSSYVERLDTGAVVQSTRADLPRPIASLTKLTTAMVLLDARVDLDRSVAYDPARHYAYRNWMHFARGDRLQGRDLFLALLVGSQNIPARMLVDLTPYTEREFIAAMNTKARALGLRHTKFVDVHGLDPANVSTAAEVARTFAAALEYPEIRSMLARSRATVTVTARNGRTSPRQFAHTNILLKQWQRFATEASKTGYLHEAGDTIAMLIRDPKTGSRAIVVTLGEPRRSPRFAIARRLAERAIRATKIAGTIDPK